MADIVDRLREWVAKEWECQEPEALVNEAIGEIISLRSMLTRDRESIHDVIRELGKWSHMAGFLQGGMDSIERRTCDPIKVARRCRQKYEETSK